MPAYLRRYPAIQWYNSTLKDKDNLIMPWDLVR